MPWRFADCETDASLMRSLAKGSGEQILSAREIGRLAGITFTIRAACGCEAEVEVDDFRVRLHAHGHVHTQNFNNAHELGHFIRALNDDAWPHDEDRADWTGLALLMPTAPVRELVKRVGLRNPRAITRAFEDVPPAWAYLRAAWVAGRAAAVHRDGERLVWAPEGYVVPERGTWWEQRLVRAVRSTGRWQPSLQGAKAFPLGDASADGVVVLLPENVLVTGW